MTSHLSTAAKNFNLICEKSLGIKNKILFEDKAIRKKYPTEIIAFYTIRGTNFSICQVGKSFLDLYVVEQGKKVKNKFLTESDLIFLKKYTTSFLLLRKKANTYESVCIEDLLSEVNNDSLDFIMLYDDFKRIFGDNLQSRYKRL